MPKTKKRIRKPNSRSPGAAVQDAPGFAVRRLAAEALVAVLKNRRSLDEMLDSASGLRGITELPDRDRALLRMLVATALRRLGTLRAILGRLTERGLPKDATLVEPALLLGIAQILYLEVPDHAAVDLSVRIASMDRGGRYAGMVNAVLRRVTREREELLKLESPELDTPDWLFARWENRYGRRTAAAIAAAHRLEPPLDISVKNDAQRWALRLGGVAISDHTVRLSGGVVTELPGFAEGDWWVQDFAATLPVRLLGDVMSKRVADLCAAPGGKTVQLAAAGAAVTAVDRSPNRMLRLRSNLERLKLSADVIVADATTWTSEPFDAVLLDAPCSATGTVRRHPEILWQKREDDLKALVALQQRLLRHAATLLKPGGLLVYATCSLEPEEAEMQIEAFLSAHENFRRVPVTAAEIGGYESLVSTAGDLRTLPCHLPADQPRMSGCDGFFSARLQRLP